MSDQTLTWIHLSDLHIEPEDRFNRGVVLEALWRDIESFVSNGLQPDFVTFTGDIAYHATAQEYELAAKEFFDPLMASAKIGKERLFLVPGNHDANWAITSMLKSPIANIRTNDDIRKVLESPEEKEVLLTPFSNYRSFVRSYLSPAQELADPAFAYRQKIEKGDFLISLVGLNSAWLSGFNRDAKGTVDDFGKLAIGEYQLRPALPAGAHFKIILMHHPFEWLMEVDRSTSEELLARNKCIVVRGHLHRSDILGVSSLAGNLAILPAGSVFDSRYSPNAYNIVHIDLNRGTGMVRLRRYNARRNEWQKDLEATGEEEDGRVVLKLPGFWWASTVQMGGEPDTKFDAYAITFTDSCKSDIASLGLTEDAIWSLVRGEFRSHLNYFRFDLEDYPLPVKTNYIVFLDKVNDHIEFRRVVPCTKNEAELSSWNDILALYRRATRLVYRRDPSTVLFVKGQVGRVGGLHLEIEKRIEKHFREFQKVTVDPDVLLSAQELLSMGLTGKRKKELENSIPLGNPDQSAMRNEIAFHLQESRKALYEAYETVRLVDAGDINENDGIGLIVAAFERSLQHIHKVILGYSPIGR